MMNLDFRSKIVVFLSTVFLVATVSKNTVFFLLVLLLFIYLCLLKHVKVGLKCTLVILFVVILRVVSNGEGFGILIPEMFLFIITRMLTVFMSIIPIISTPPGEITAILKKYKVNRNIALPLIFMLRFFPIIRNEFKEIIDNLKVRGLFSLKKPLVTMEYVFIPMMFQAATTAEEIAAAAEVRGISNPGKHTSRREIKMTMIDFILILITILVSIFLVLLEGGRI